VKLETEAFAPSLYNPVRLSAFHLLIEERQKKRGKTSEVLLLLERVQRKEKQFHSKGDKLV
jgi:hypothetical protein